MPFLQFFFLQDVPDQEMEELTTYADDQLEDLDFEELTSKIQVIMQSFIKHICWCNFEFEPKKQGLKSSLKGGNILI